MEETSVFPASARGEMELPTASADTTLQTRFAWVSASTGASPSLSDQFAAFADELLEWAELDMAAGLEGWPDDDWSDLKA
jgi:hypothetical protein